MKRQNDCFREEENCPPTTEEEYLHEVRRKRIRVGTIPSPPCTPQQNNRVVSRLWPTPGQSQAQAVETTLVNYTNQMQTAMNSVLFEVSFRMILIAFYS
jgi:hypothetical protein